MTSRRLTTLLTVNAAVGLGFGLTLMILPGPLLRLFDLDIGSAGELVARLYGTELLGFNAATWMARTPDAATSLRAAVVAGHVVNEGAGFLVISAAIAAGLGNALVWPLAALFLGFAAAYGTTLPMVLRERRSERAPI